tara:strand:- start:526 stop:705 length:180 start_codon:yes stop_codon:yes gene_type:complete
VKIAPIALSEHKQALLFRQLGELLLRKRQLQLKFLIITIGFAVLLHYPEARLNTTTFPR